MTIADRQRPGAFLCAVLVTKGSIVVFFKPKDKPNAMRSRVLLMAELIGRGKFCKYQFEWRQEN